MARIESLRRATARDGYDRDAFGTAYSSLEDEIIAALPSTMKANGQVYTPYSCLAFDITADGTAAPDIEHIVALGEAHDSGIADDQRRDIASDLDNLTIADPTVNRSQKSDLDAAKWMPMRHGAWFTEWVIQVKLEYGLSVDPAERDALVGAAGGGRSSTELRWRRASTGAPTPWGTRARLGAGTAQRLWVADPIRDCSLTHDFGQRLTALSLTAGLEPSTVPSPARGRLHRARTRRSGSPYPAHDRDGLLSGTMTGAALTASEAGRCCDGNEFRALGIHDRFLDSID